MCVSCLIKKVQTSWLQLLTPTSTDFQTLTSLHRKVIPVKDDTVAKINWAKN